MNDADLAERLRVIAGRVRAPANRFAEGETVRSVIKVIEAMDAADFSEVRAALLGEPFESCGLDPLNVRLQNLHHRLEADGQYVNANTVWLALQKIEAAS